MTNITYKIHSYVWSKLVSQLSIQGYPKLNFDFSQLKKRFNSQFKNHLRLKIRLYSND